MKGLLVFLCFLLAAAVGQAQTVTPLPGAHAHNDYEHKRPLLDALDHGFTSIEADVQLIDGKLYVGHNMPKGKNNLPTLEDAYMKPLEKRIKSHRGQVYEGYAKPVYLMIDFKTEAGPTYAALEKILSKYQDMLTSWQGTVQHNGPILVFISGNRPIETILHQAHRLAALDGRPEDLGKGIDAAYMPVVSDDYHKIIQWDGTGKIPDSDMQTLETLARKTHAEGKKLRLWATPETEDAWAALKKAGIDFLNTDQLARLQQFLLKHSK